MVHKTIANEWFQSILADTRFTFRQLRKSPVFTIVVIVTLALGIGANTVIFTIVQNVLLAPLPFQNPDRLVVLWENNPRFKRAWVSYPNFRDWQRDVRAFHEMAAFREQGVNLTAPGAPERMNSKQISSTFFSTLGVAPALGRGFSFDEDRQGGTPAAVVSNQLWQTRFASSPDVLGKTVTLDGVDYTIVGVAPQTFDLSGNSGFRLQGETQVYTPLGQADPLILNDRSAHSGIFAFARVDTEATLSQSQAEMSTIQNRLDRLYPEANRDIGIYVEPLKQVIVGDVSRILLLLFGAVGLVLLVACANVANLLLSRGAVRAHEFAIRSALGADRRRIVQQLLTESVVLSLTGAGLGLLIAAVALRPLLATFSISLPRGGEVGINAPILVFTFSISVIVGVLFGIAPALKNSHFSPQHDLKAGERSSTGAHHRIQNALVITQMALTVVLLAGAGLLLRTIHHLSEINPGFDAERITTFRVGVSPSLLKTGAATRATYQQLLQRIRDIPGVQEVDFTEVLPLSDSGIMPFWINSQKPLSLQGAPRLAAFLTGPDYLKTMGIPLLRGRFFTTQDTTQSPCVAVIDSVFAKMYFKDNDPLNQTISAGFATFGPCRIVGVVGHVKEWSLDESSTDIQNQAYFSLYQDPDRWVPVNYPDTTMVVRTRLELGTLMPLVKRAVYSVAGDQPIYSVRTMRQIVSDSMSAQRFPMTLLIALAALALFMASIGVYGVISYSTSQRLREIGIRLALGAERRGIFRMIVGYGLRLTIVGLATGVATALVLLRLLRSFSHLLSGVGAYDPATFGGISLLLAVVAFLACYIPARRAMNVDPLAILRYE